MDYSSKEIQKTLKKDQNDVIVHHNSMIEARYHLTLQEKRLMYWLSSQVKQTDEDFKEHELPIKEFAKLVEAKGDHLYKSLDTISHKLMQKIITIKSIDDTGFVKAALLGGVKYLKNKGILKLSFHPYLKPYMLQLNECFTKISMGDVVGLKSIYSVRIYELLKQYENIGKRELSLSELREFFGISLGKYKRFNDFKKDVLERAKKEINAKTEYDIDYTEKKEARKVVGLEWTIKKKTHFEKFQEEKARIIQKELRSGNVIIQELLEYGFTLPHSRKIVKDNDHETLVNAIKSVDIQVERGRAKNPKAMLIKAIQEKWHPEKFVDRKPKAS
jgi:plasmid replication initiation protein